MSDVVTYDEDVLKRQFIELYYMRGTDDSPNRLMDKINAPRRMLTEWISDVAFQRELDQIDQERAWLAKEVIYRRINDIFENISQLAIERNRNSIKAAELMFRIAGILKTAGGGGTQVTINNTLGEEAMKGLSLEELVSKRDELAQLLTNLSATPAEFEEEAP